MKKELIEELTELLSVNSYSPEFVRDRLEKLWDVAEANGRVLEAKETMRPDIIGSHVTEPEQVEIKPEDMVKGEWYVLKDKYRGDFLFKLKERKGLKIWYHIMVNYTVDIHYDDCMVFQRASDYIVPATRSEVLKYFPDEKFND